MGAASAIKYILFFFNLLICIGGLILLGLGVYLNIHVGAIGDVASNSISIAFIVIGSCIFLFAFLGCCGAIKESHCMLTTFGILLSILLTIQLIGAILIFIFQNKMKAAIHENLKDSLKGYDYDQKAKTFWDTLQKEFKCCGVNNPSDFTGGTPPSCSCVESSKTCSAGHYSEGCFHKFTEVISKHGLILAVVAVALAVIELIGAIFSFRLASTIKRRGHGF